MKRLAVIQDRLCYALFYVLDDIRNRLREAASSTCHSID
jgi:hypothetical protein